MFLKEAAATHEKIAKENETRRAELAWWIVMIYSHKTDLQNALWLNFNIV